MHGAPLAKLEGVSKRYLSGTLALDDLSLTIGKEEFVSLVGASGCGKSTVLRLIAGLAAPSAGRVALDMPPTEVNGHDIGVVFQEPTLMPWASVADNVYLPLRLKGVQRARASAAVGEALEMVGLAQFAQAYPRELSGGMKMRVSIARALVHRPRLLLLDEPFAALDEMTRSRLNDDLLALWRRNRWTVVFVTHSVYESVYLSSRVLVMSPRPGRVVAEVAIDAPYPRDELFRTSERYNAYCRAVSRALRTEAADA